MEHKDVNSAIIAAVAALVGVILGGYFQYRLWRSEHERKKEAAVQFASILTADIGSVFEGFNSELNVEWREAFSETIPESYCTLLGESRKLLYEYDPVNAVRLFWVEQAANNVRELQATYRKVSLEHQAGTKTDKALKTSIETVVIEAKGGISRVNESLISFYNYAGKTQRRALEKHVYFKKLMKEKLSQKNWLARFFFKARLRRVL
jgi:hypothetical protein